MNNQQHRNQGPILVVDDDPAFLSGVALLLNFAGYSVLTARDGIEALERVVEASPKLILLDLLMPVMGGRQFLAALRQLDSQVYRAIPVIVMTVDRDAARDVGVLGADGLLIKPFEPGELIQVVSRFCPSS